jgi:hypothetical protein
MPEVSWLAEPIAAICELRFATVMLEAVNQLVGVDHCADGTSVRDHFVRA